MSCWDEGSITEQRPTEKRYDIVSLGSHNSRPSLASPESAGRVKEEVLPTRKTKGKDLMQKEITACAMELWKRS